MDEYRKKQMIDFDNSPVLNYEAKSILNLVCGKKYFFSNKHQTVGKWPKLNKLHSKPKVKYSNMCPSWKHIKKCTSKVLISLDIFFKLLKAVLDINFNPPPPAFSTNFPYDKNKQ